MITKKQFKSKVSMTYTKSRETLDKAVKKYKPSGKKYLKASGYGENPNQALRGFNINRPLVKTKKLGRYVVRKHKGGRK